jgi:hypothetical protein
MKPLLQAVQVVLDVQLFWTQLIPHMSVKVHDDHVPDNELLFVQTD